MCTCDFEWLVRSGGSRRAQSHCVREGTGWVPYVTGRLQKHLADLPWHFSSYEAGHLKLEACGWWYSAPAVYWKPGLEQAGVFCNGLGAFLPRFCSEKC